jgi:two-component system response regulator (stage 0 sporulation protein A)
MDDEKDGNNEEQTDKKDEWKRVFAEKYAPHFSFWEPKIKGIFLRIGISPKLKGYRYLCAGIQMAIEKPELMNGVTTRLYPEIGEQFHASASKVERAIRNAIQTAWDRGRTDAIRSVFGAHVYICDERPTNSEFIALMADKLLLETL